MTTRLVESRNHKIIVPQDSQKFRMNRGDFFVTGSNDPYYLLEAGKAIVYTKFPKADSKTGFKEVCIGLYSKNSLFGEPLGKVKHPYTKKIRAVSEEAVIRVIQRGSQIANPDDRILLIKASDNDKTTQENRIALMTQANHLRYKVAWALLALTSPGDREVPTSQQIMADLTASTRANVNTALRGFERSGILFNNSATYRITEPDGVEKLETILTSMNPHLVPG